MLVFADHGHVLEPARVIDQHPPTLREDGVVRGVPGDADTGGDPADREVPDHTARQRPLQTSPGAIRLGRRRFPGVVSPGPPAPGALGAAHPNEQRRRPPSHRLVREAPGDGVPGDVGAAASMAPVVTLEDPEFEYRTPVLEMLPHSSETELV